jgi:hypothetical protein
MWQTYAARYDDDDQKEYFTAYHTLTAAGPGLADPDSLRTQGGEKLQYLNVGRYRRPDNGRIILCNDLSAP